MLISRKLRKSIRRAAVAPAPKKIEPKIEEVIDSLGEDVEEVKAFLESLQNMDAKRTATYLATIKASKKAIWKKLAQEAKEPDPPDFEGAGDAEDQVDTPPKPTGVAAKTKAKNPEKPPFEEAGDAEDQLSASKPSKQAAAEDEGEDEEGAEEEEVEGQEGDEAAEEVENTEEEEEIADDAEEASTEEPAIEPVVDPEELSPDSKIDMVLLDQEGDNPHYAVFADGKPIADIALEDQPNPEEIKDLFVSEDYSDHVSEACLSSVGVKNTLDALNAKYYAAVSNRGKVAEEAREVAAKNMEEDFATRLAALKENFLNHANLAVVASLKGMFVGNKLREDLNAALKSAGVFNSDALIHDAFMSSGQDYMTDIVTQAEKWMGYSPEAMDEIMAEVLGANPSEEPSAEQVEQETTEETAERQASVAAHGIANVPIITRRQQTGDFKEDARARIASTLGRRRANKLIR